VTKVEDEALVDRLMRVFRTHGYEGASLSRISEATGLQRASLYHRFPGGKAEMAEAVLEHAHDWLREHALEPLARTGDPKDRLAEMCGRLDEFYESGRRSCILEALSLGNGDNPFREDTRDAIGTWTGAIADVLEEAGRTREEAEARARDAVIRIQGSLVVARATGDPGVFRETLDALPDELVR